MTELLDATATILLAAVLFVVGATVVPESGLFFGTVGALAGGYVGGRVGTLRQRVDDLEARLDD